MLARVCTLEVIVALCGFSVFKTQVHGQSLREAIDAILVEFPRRRAGPTDVKIGQGEIVNAQSFRRLQLGLSLRGGEEDGHSYYQILIQTGERSLKTTTERFEILPEMAAQVDIKTGKKSVLDYLLKPLMRTKMNAFTER